MEYGAENPTYHLPSTTYQPTHLPSTTYHLPPIDRHKGDKTMLGNQGLTAAKFDTNVRALRGTVMGLPVTNPSTESDFYVGLPSGFNTVPTGVLSMDVVE